MYMPHELQMHVTKERGGYMRAAYRHKEVLGGRRWQKEGHKKILMPGKRRVRGSSISILHLPACPPKTSQRTSLFLSCSFAAAFCYYYTLLLFHCRHATAARLSLVYFHCFHVIVIVFVIFVFFFLDHGEGLTGSDR